MSEFTRREELVKQIEESGYKVRRYKMPVTLGAPWVVVGTRGIALVHDNLDPEAEVTALQEVLATIRQIAAGAVA